MQCASYERSAARRNTRGTIEAWRNRPIAGDHPYVYLDGIVLKRSWAGEVRNVSLLVAIGVNERGYREILGICEGAKEDKTGWSAIAFVIYGTALHATHQGQISGVKQVQDAVRRFL